MWPASLCSATTCHLTHNWSRIYIYTYIYRISHTHTHTRWPKVLVSLATGVQGDIVWQCCCSSCMGQEGHSLCGERMKRVFDSSSLAARCPQVRSLRLQFEFATSCTERTESARGQCEACGMRQVAGKTVKEIKYFAQPWLFNELNCSTNNIYLRPAYFAYDIRYSNTITCAVNLQLK